MQTKEITPLNYLSGLLHLLPFWRNLGALITLVLKRGRCLFRSEGKSESISTYVSLHSYSGLLLVPVFVQFFWFVQPNQFIQISYDSYRYSSNLDYSQFLEYLF